MNRARARRHRRRERTRRSRKALNAKLNRIESLLTQESGSRSTADRTETGRTSSSQPNTQSIRRKITDLSERYRQQFIANNAEITEHEGVEEAGVFGVLR